LPLALLGGFGPRQTPSHYIQTGTVEELYDLFRRTPDRVPLISAHRGGPAPRFPENCIPTFQRTLGQGYALIEFDVQLSKDDSLVVMHDDRLDRTTNGTGPVKDHTYGQLRKLRLEDNEGTLTPYGIPTLSEVLWWAKGKTILTLDPKRGVPPERIVAAIREAEAEAYTVVITYTADQAARYHQLHPGLVLSVSVKQARRPAAARQPGRAGRPDAGLRGRIRTGLVAVRIVARKGIYASLGTMGNLDKMAEARGEEVYRDLVRRGADVLSTDRPAEVAQAFAPLLPRRSSKARTSASTRCTGISDPVPAGLLEIVDTAQLNRGRVRAVIGKNFSEVAGSMSRRTFFWMTRPRVNSPNHENRFTTRTRIPRSAPAPMPEKLLRGDFPAFEKECARFENVSRTAKGVFQVSKGRTDSPTPRCRT
jgi:glycerophosphoryl diester phosphodiesterase